MKYALIVLGILVMTPAAAWAAAPEKDKDAIAIYGHGNSTCADYTQFQFDRNEPVLTDYQVWVNGFVSAYNTLISESGDVARGRTSKDFTLWLEDYCRIHPDSFFQRAVIEMLRSMETGEF
jgi:hypothetical protein